MASFTIEDKIEYRQYVVDGVLVKEGKRDCETEWFPVCKTDDCFEIVKIQGGLCKACLLPSRRGGDKMDGKKGGLK